MAAWGITGIGCPFPSGSTSQLVTCCADAEEDKERAPACEEHTNSLPHQADR
jgi:hypothetical protein